MNITTTEGKQITLVMPFQIVRAGGQYIKAIGQNQWFCLVEWKPGQAPVVSHQVVNPLRIAEIESRLYSLPSVNLRAFEVRYVGPTDHKPSRIKIIDHYNKESVTISNKWLYDYNQITDGAKAYLNSLGIEITNHANSLHMDLLLSPNFETRLKNAK